MAPIMRTYWALGEDLGVRQSDIDEILARRGLGAGLSAVDKLITDPETAAARSTTAFATVDDGVAQDELVGGLGVAASAIAALDAAGQDPADCRAVIQGCGSMGGPAHDSSPRPECASSASPTPTGSSRIPTVSTSRR